MLAFLASYSFVLYLIYGAFLQLEDQSWCCIKSSLH